MDGDKSDGYECCEEKESQEGGRRPEGGEGRATWIWRKGIPGRENNLDVLEEGGLEDKGDFWNQPSCLLATISASPAPWPLLGPSCSYCHISSFLRPGFCTYSSLYLFVCFLNHRSHPQESVPILPLEREHLSLFLSVTWYGFIFLMVIIFLCIHSAH